MRAVFFPFGRLQILSDALAHNSDHLCRTVGARLEVSLPSTPTIVFLGGQDDSLEDLGRLNVKQQELARNFGRKVGAYVLLTVIAEETDEAASAKRDFLHRA